MSSTDPTRASVSIHPDVSRGLEGNDELNMAPTMLRIWAVFALVAVAIAGFVIWAANGFVT